MKEISEKYVATTMSNNDEVLCDIYKITNLVTGKQYVGQANTHRLNHGKYRPFGYTRRFTDHISEAMCNTKKKQCSYLNNSIRKHGVQNFKVELLERCLPSQANDLEIKYISDLDTLYPKGYNLSIGGRKGCILLEHRIKTMHNSMKQYEESKLAKYANVKIDKENLEKYIYERRSYGQIYYCIIVDGIKSIFVAKYLEPKEIKQLALNFLKKICEQNDSAT